MIITGVECEVSLASKALKQQSELMALFEIEMGGSFCIIIEIVQGVVIELNLEIGLAGIYHGIGGRVTYRFDINHRSM